VTEAKLVMDRKVPAARLCVCRDGDRCRRRSRHCNLNGKDFQGRTLTVNEARERSAGGGGGRGGFGGGGGGGAVVAAAAVVVRRWRRRGSAGRPSVKPFNKSALKSARRRSAASNGRRKRLNVCSSASKSERSAAL